MLLSLSLVLSDSQTFVASRGAYVALRTGAVMLENGDLSISRGGLTGSGTIDYNTGFDVGGTLGVHVARLFRVEGKIFYSKAGLDKVESGSASTSVNGYFSSLAFMGNACVDLPLSNMSVKP